MIEAVAALHPVAQVATVVMAGLVVIAFVILLISRS